MIAQFCLLLVLGMSLMWGLMPRKQVTAGFFRVQMLVVLGLSVLAFLTLGRLRVLPGEPLSDQSMFVSQCSAGAIAFVAYVGSVLWTLNRRPAGTVCNFAVLALAFVNLVLSRGHGVWLATPSGAFLFLSNISTSAVLGGSVTSMLLGHWYLTAPTMSIEPLKHLCRLFGAAVCLRLLVSVVGWFIGGHSLHDGTHYTWFAMRWLAGLLGPLVIACMADRILRYRNTQAATGVLFAGVILTFIGEMSAALLYTELHVSL
ncbi:MAG: hypothetical protein NTW75_13395 [Planctomycetales bacterium]|jgi:hypothetical protein|nr:hypothetical protein [Planctomycetales bacterium]